MSEANWNNASRALKQRFIEIRDNTMAAFLKREVPILTSKIAETFYTRGGQGVNVRSGHARSGWTTIFPEPTKAVVVNTVPYADFSTEKYITPKKGKFLAIPIGNALTPAGVPRYIGPRDPKLPKLTLIQRPGKPALLAEVKGKRIDLYFLLLKSVRIPAYTKELGPFVQAEAMGIRDRFIPVFRQAMQAGGVGL